MSPGSRPSHGAFPVRDPAASTSRPRITTARPNTNSNLPSSVIAIPLPQPLEGKLPLAALRGRHGVAEVGVGGGRRLAAAGASDDVADLQQEGLDDLGQRLALVVDRGRDGLEADWAAPVLLDDGNEESAVESVEPRGVHALAVERVAGRRRRHHAVALDLAVVTDAAQQAVGDARRSARAA